VLVQPSPDIRRPKCGASTVILLALMPLVAFHSKKVREIYTFPDHSSPGLDQGAGLIDVDNQGRLLIWQGPYEAHLPYLLWDFQRQAVVSNFSAHIPKEVQAKSLPGPTGIFFQPSGRVVVFRRPWLILEDPIRNEEIRHVVPNPLYLGPGILNRPGTSAGGPGIEIPAINPHDGSVAVAFNVHGNIMVYVYDAELEKPLGAWSLPRYVQGLAWSPAGDRLAILFNGRLDGTGPPITEDDVYQFHEGNRTAPGDDVWIVEPRSGNPLVKFRTGSNEWRIAFSPDGRIVYVIQDFYYSYPPDRSVIQGFSAISGDRVHTFTAGPRGVHMNFAVSPDGKLIAADASTEVRQMLPWREPVYGAKMARVVLLDSGTGKLLFEHDEKTEGEFSDPLEFAFSPDSRFLFVNFALSDHIPYNHIEVFSLDDLRDQGG